MLLVGTLGPRWKPYIGAILGRTLSIISLQHSFITLSTQYFTQMMLIFRIKGILRTFDEIMVEIRNSLSNNHQLAHGPASKKQVITFVDLRDLV